MTRMSLPLLLGGSGRTASTRRLASGSTVQSLSTQTWATLGRRIMLSSCSKGRRWSRMTSWPGTILRLFFPVPFSAVLPRTCAFLCFVLFHFVSFVVLFVLFVGVDKAWSTQRQSNRCTSKCFSSGKIVCGGLHPRYLSIVIDVS